MYISKSVIIRIIYLIFCAILMYCGIDNPVYYGDGDSLVNDEIWWGGYYTVISSYGFILLYRVQHILSEKKSLFSDKAFVSLLVAGFVSLLYFVISPCVSFTDENDNIRGGMLIAKGCVLYNDYIVQHPPVMYYLCALFSILGALSVQQFRLIYYIFQGLIWAGVFYRYAPMYGYIKCFYIPILITIMSAMAFVPQGWQILSDDLEGIGLVVLLLEFGLLCKRRKVSWPSAFIIGLSVNACIGTAFISAYPVSIILLGILLIFIKYLLDEKITRKIFIQSIYRISVSIFALFALWCVYFYSNNAHNEAFSQIYLFNREVYPKYTGGFGLNVLEPFYKGVINYFSAIYNMIPSKVPANKWDVISFFYIFMVAVLNSFSTLSCLLLVRKHKYFLSTILFFTMCSAMARGTSGFHVIPEFYVAVTVVIIVLGDYVNTIKKNTIASINIVLVVIWIIFSSVILYKSPDVRIITPLEKYIVEHTVVGDGVLLDAYTCDSIYLLVKERNLVNKAVYFLPWYMEWYEDSLIEDLELKKPIYVIYDEEKIVWNRYVNFTPIFAEQLKKDYCRLSDDPNDKWKYNIWIRKE